MALRALLFSSDGSATAAICDTLTDLSIEAEICTEVLVASERIARENYDVILVDWDHEADSVVLLKAAREKKGGQALNLALVKQDMEVGRALQQGANSVIKKPIDHRQAEDTLSTARDLILSRRAEQKSKEARIAAVNAEASAESGKYTDDTPAQKTGFLQQTAPRSAFDAATQAAQRQTANSQPSDWQTARGPEEVRADPEQVQEVRPPEVRVPEKRRWDEGKPLPKIEGPEYEEQDVQSGSQDSTRVFSWLSEESETEPEPETRPKPHSQRLGFVLVACLLVVGVFYVWAPGDSYLGRLQSIWHLLPLRGNAKTVSAPQPATAAQAAPEQVAAKVDDPAADAPLATTDVDPSKIHIIETKTIPKPGAQVPPSDNPPPDSDQAKAKAQPEVIAGSAPGATDPAAPLAVPEQRQPQVKLPAPAPAKPAIVSVAQQQPTVQLPTADSPNAANRTGVIIPDSLRNTPSPSAGSSVEPTTISEDAARSLLIQSVEPDYPAQAQQQHLEGSVVLQVWVARDGSVQDVKLMKGYIQLGRAAVNAVRQWRFRPFARGGQAIGFQTPITVAFKRPQ
jgi:protein TonB